MQEKGNERQNHQLQHFSRKEYAFRIELQALTSSEEQTNPEEGCQSFVREAKASARHHISAVLYQYSSQYSLQIHFCHANLCSQRYFASPPRLLGPQFSLRG